jgi:hypothetical protein
VSEEKEQQVKASLALRVAGWLGRLWFINISDIEKARPSSNLTNPRVGRISLVRLLQVPCFLQMLNF